MESHLLPNRWNWNNINYLIISPIFITLLVVSKSYCCTQLSISATCPPCKLLTYQFSSILCIKGQIDLNVTNVFIHDHLIHPSIHPSILFFLFSFLLESQQQTQPVKPLAPSSQAHWQRANRSCINRIWTQDHFKV